MAGGRQRQFDKQEALKNAMGVFWKKGFLGASLSDLTLAMGINKPSMYGTFGNKEQLFIKATEYYIDNFAIHHARHLTEEGKSLKDRLRGYLLSAVKAQCDDSHPKGCYISLCVSEAASETIPQKASEVIERARDFTEFHLKDFFRDEINRNNLPLETARA